MCAVQNVQRCRACPGWIYGSITIAGPGSTPWSRTPDCQPSEIIRNLIDQAYEGVLKKERQNAFERLISLNIETPPDPAELSRELEEAHAPGHIY